MAYFAPHLFNLFVEIGITEAAETLDDVIVQIGIGDLFVRKCVEHGAGPRPPASQQIDGLSSYCRREAFPICQDAPSYFRSGVAGHGPQQFDAQLVIFFRAQQSFPFGQRFGRSRGGNIVQRIESLGQRQGGIAAMIQGEF